MKGKPPDNSVVALNKLKTDQVRVFGRNMGVPGCFSKSKFLCHVVIANHFDFHSRLGKYGLSPTARANQTTSNLCRAINVVFSDSFVNDLKTFNDKKSQHDYETSNTHKHFWIHATLAYNNQQDDDVACNVNEVIHDTFDTAAAVATELDPEETDDASSNVDVALGVMKHSTIDGIVLDEFSLIVAPTNDPYLADLEDNKEINMTKSGTHDNNTLNFIQVAMQEFHGFTPIAVYYFYTGCNEHLDIDSIFQPTMDESLKGNSITVANNDSDTPPSSEESKLTRPSKGDDNLSTIMKQGLAMVDLLQSSMDEQKKDIDE